jgi:NAD(P)-dependent dehydrogenase (short-subunit alcohol dehydrogenase family)
MAKLEGVVAIVTGANRGIGKGTARGLVREGASVVLAARDEALLKQAAEEIGGTTLVVPTDVAEEGQVEKLFEKTMQRFGRVDILVNNAGVGVSGPIEELSVEGWEKVMAVNLRGPFLCTRAAFRIMKKQGGGRIINVASISGQRVRPQSAPYSVSKHGLWGLTQVAALEGREYGIACSCLYPGNTLVESIAARWPQGHPEPHMAVEELAEACVFMACQPPHVNVLDMTVLPVRQLFLGRG